MKYRVDTPSSWKLELIGNRSEYFSNLERTETLRGKLSIGESSLQVLSVQPNLISKVKRGKTACGMCCHLLSC